MGSEVPFNPASGSTVFSVALAVLTQGDYITFTVAEQVEQHTGVNAHHGMLLPCVTKADRSPEGGINQNLLITPSPCWWNSPGSVQLSGDSGEGVL